MVFKGICANVAEWKTAAFAKQASRYNAPFV
jgi:hypothetical protein